MASFSRRRIRNNLPRAGDDRGGPGVHAHLTRVRRSPFIGADIVTDAHRSPDAIPVGGHAGNRRPGVDRRSGRSEAVIVLRGIHERQRADCQVRSVRRFNRTRTEDQQIAYIEAGACRGRRLEGTHNPLANGAVPDMQALDVVFVAIGRQHVVDDRVLQGHPGSRSRGSAAAQPERDFRIEDGDAVEGRVDVLLEIERGHVADQAVAEAPRRRISNRQRCARETGVGFRVDGVLAGDRAGRESVFRSRERRQPHPHVV